LGLSIQLSFILIAVIAALLSVGGILRKKISWSWQDKTFSSRPSIWEGLLAFFIFEKTIWSFYSLAKLPIYFDDALNHWSGRGKALLSGTNWSWDSTSIYFMGDAFGHEQYPLFASIWRASNAALLGHHDHGLERVDGFIFWMIILIVTIHWITEVTGKRWLGLIGAVIIAGIPLQTWHATAGYAEIYIQAYLLLSIWCIMQKRYLLAGVCSAAMIWSKNEGLVIFVPCLIACLFIKLYLDKSTSVNDRLKSFFRYNLAWLVAIAPWLIFKVTKGLGFTIPTEQGIGYVEGALGKFAQAMFDSPSSSILWIFALLTMILCFKRIWQSNKLLPLAASCIILLLMMVFVFTSTGAYTFLENQMTIHRSLLQIAPPFIILICLALSENGFSSSSE